MKKEPTLDNESAEAAAHLRALFNEKKEKISQEEFGAKYEIGSQGMVWQYLNGHRPLNLKAAIGFARGLGVALEDISPEIAEQVAVASSLFGSAHSVSIPHQGFPQETDFQKLPIDVTKALQSALSAFRKGADIRNSDLRLIVGFALEPAESGTMARSPGPAHEHEQTIVERAAAAMNRAGNEHVDQIKGRSKKRH